MSRLTREDHDEVVVLRLDAPDRRNALDLPTMVELVRQLRDADHDEAVRAIVLTGADPAFCAGLDLEAIGAGELVLEEVTELDGDPWQTLQELATPTLAAVNGAAVTGGLELVLCCDLAIASDRARFADTHARVGIQPSGGLTVLLPRYIGLRGALGMSLTGRFVPAGEAATLGLVNAVVPHDELSTTALSVAHSIAELDPTATRELVETYRVVSGLPYHQGLEVERSRGRAAKVDVEAVAEGRREVIERGRRLTRDT